MTIGKYVRWLLTADAGVAALAADRVFTEFRPQAGEVPAVVSTQNSGDEDVALNGPTGASSRSMQVDSWTQTRADATALGVAVRDALANHVGVAAGLEVQGVFRPSERRDFDAETALYRTSNVIDVWLVRGRDAVHVPRTKARSFRPTKSAAKPSKGATGKAPKLPVVTDVPAAPCAQS